MNPMLLGLLNRNLKPVFWVTAITYRNDPIQVHSCMGVPVDDSAVVTTVIRAANILEELKGNRFPVKMVYCPPEAVPIWL
jgi:UbiD family decarboxylase